MAELKAFHIQILLERCPSGGMPWPHGPVAENLRTAHPSVSPCTSMEKMTTT